jgi:phosphopantothenoylcysteine decarboxylase / phosphopantothenate---cysteine ligase
MAKSARPAKAAVNNEARVVNAEARVVAGPMPGAELLALHGRHLVLGVSGGVAGYKVADLSRQLQKHGATVQVVMSEAATRFVTPVTFQALSGRPVFTDQWDGRIGNNMAHIDLTRGADAILIAPASADLIAKLANGIADELLPLLALARQCPLLIAPAMNLQMWSHPATQRNLAQLRRDGVVVLGPGSGIKPAGKPAMAACWSRSSCSKKSSRSCSPSHWPASGC